MKFHLDFETRSAVDIKKIGAWGYAMHPSTEVLCLAVAQEGKEPSLYEGKRLHSWRWNLPEDAILVAHNAHFEYAIYNYVLHARYGWPAIWEPTRWSCTLARAAMCGLPISLGACAEALNLQTLKDLKGRSAMMKLCKPMDYDPISGDPIYNEDPALYALLYPYCVQDVRTEMAIDAKLPELPQMERKVWELDLLINRRGVAVDTSLASKAATIAKDLTDKLNGDLERLTGGAVTRASRVQEIKRYIGAQGIAAESLDKAAVIALLEKPETPQKVKDVVRIRQQVGKSSTAKYAATLAAVCQDNRVRGALQYHAAATGRWGGRLVQPQNYPKGLGEEAQSLAIDAIEGGDAEVFSLIYGDKAMDTLSGVLRGTFVAPPGKKLVVADYNAIEARVLFWLADDQSALETYRKGGSPYLDMGAFIYRRPISKTKDPLEYAISKMTVLGAGYGMGSARFIDQCKSQANLVIPQELAQRAIKAYRQKYHLVPKLWSAMEAAAKAAIREPGLVIQVSKGRIRFGMDAKREFLVCRLPSGRHLRYFRPAIKGYVHPLYGDREEVRYWAGGLKGTLEEFGTYGGALTENVVQAVARDIMANGQLEAEKDGFGIVLHSHDELVSEAGETPGVLEKLIEAMCRLPQWAQGCPIAAEGFVAGRYRK